MMTLLLIIIYVSFISLGLPDSLLGSAWPSIRMDLSVPVSYAGIVSMIVSGGTIISSLFSSRLIRKWGTGLVTTISVAMTAIALIGFSIAPSFIWLCVLAIPLGLGAGSVDAALNNFVALHYKAKHMNWLHCFWGIGATAGPIIMAVWLAKNNEWKMGYRTIGVIQIVLAIILVISLPLWKKMSNNSSEDREDENVSFKLKDLLHIKGAKQVFIGFLCYCALEATTGLWGSSYLVINKGISTETAASWISLFYLGITVGRLLSGFISIKLSNAAMIRMGQAIIVCGVILMNVPLGSSIMPVGFFLIGMGCAPIYPSMLHQTPKNFGASMSQAMMGIQMACAYVGATFMPPLFGLLAESISISLFPFYIISILILMVIMTEKSNRLTN